MVDRLKHSLERLEPPTCPECNIDMRWTRSTLVASDPVTIAHLFQCPSCGGLAETTSTGTASEVPPGKLSAPQRHGHAA